MRCPAPLLPLLLVGTHQGLMHLGWSSPLLRSYGDDLLTLPIVLSLMDELAYWSGNRLSPKRRWFFVLIGWIWFSALFEGLLPIYFEEMVSDPADILAYGLGGCLYVLLSPSGSTPIPKKA